MEDPENLEILALLEQLAMQDILDCQDRLENQEPKVTNFMIILLWVGRITIVFERLNICFEFRETWTAWTRWRTGAAW